MDDSGDPHHLKRERHSAYQQPPPLHMSPADPAHLHSYHQNTPQSTHMAQPWNPAPSPYHEGHDQRQSALEVSQPHQHQQQQPQAPPPPPPPPPHHHYPPSQSYPPHPSHLPHPPPTSTPVYPPDSGYSRQNSSSGPTRSPPSAQSAHYSAPVNGAPPVDNFYHSDYRSRPSYPPPESPANATHQPLPHGQTPTHDMIPGQHQPSGPPPGYPPQPHSAGPHSAGPHPTSQYWSQAPGDWYMQKRKPVRAAQACDSCRQRKAKCDEGRPECSHCKENSLKCSYRDVAPPKSEKQMLQMSEKVDGLYEKLDVLADHVNSTEKKLEKKLESLIFTVQQLVHAGATEAKSKLNGVPMAKSRSRPPMTEEPRSISQNSSGGQHDANALFPDLAPTNEQHLPQTAESINSNNTTRGPMGAADLLSCAAVKELVPTGIPPTYVMDLEAERGLLRLYGCGEGEDRGDGHDGAPSPAPSTSSGRMECESSTSSPSGAWGTGHLPHRDGAQEPMHDHPGGVTPSGELVLDRVAVDKYVKSYLEKMHILHPFMDPRVLKKLVHTFKTKHSFDYATVSAVGARLAHTASVGTKRKRELEDSPNSITDDLPLNSIPQYTGFRNPRGNQAIEHSISSAIILLVLALGKICSYDKPLPGPPKGSTFISNVKTPIVQQPHLGFSDLPPAPPPSSAPASPYASNQTNGVFTTPAVANLQGRNMDVIPGLAYFAKAADILGELRGGIDVSHVQANLLAGLYMGQLARILSSLAYISEACKTCQVLIQTAEYKEKRMPAEQRNLINFAFWSCLQLESDILAEVPFPSSGIVQKEASMMLESPSALTIGDSTEGPSNTKELWRHYLNQIQLRRTINDCVNNIYNAERESQKPSALIKPIGENLEAWRQWLQDWNWDDDHHESHDINHARMRAKYYGARYIINRPALLYALNAAYAAPPTPLSRPSESPHTSGQISGHTSPAVNHHGNSVTNRRVTEMRPPARSTDHMEDWILAACERCISAAIKSTTVFDRVPSRLVITNILGTAHAQFGNVLVLSAAYNSPNTQLSNMVPEDVLRTLLLRTIRFLDDKAPISPALAKDAKILRFTQNRLFPSNTGAAHATSANSSFTSNR